MAGSEQVVFDVLARDRASGAFRDAGRSAADLGAKMDLAARNARVLDGALEKSRKAAQASVGATLALAKADKILDDAEHVLADGALEAEFALKKQARAAEEAGAASAGAAAGADTAAQGFGGMLTPMTGAIAAGVALAPVIATVGLGLGGLGLAAAGVVKNQKLMAQTLAPLKSQYLGFEKALQPVVLADFGDAIRVAGGLLHDLQPVSQATGKALGGLLGQIDAEFRSNNWQNFFKFMAQTAGPDIKLLGNAFVSLTGTLPTLLEALQPVATSLLTIVNYTGQAIRLSELASTNFTSLGKSAQKSGDGFNATTTGLKAAIPGMEYVSKLGHEIGSGLDVLYGNSKPAAAGLKATGASAAAAGTKLQDMGQAVIALNTAESKALDTQLAYSGALVTAASDAVGLRKALKASGDQIGLHTAAQRASFQAANTYIGDLEQTAKQSWASGHGTDGAIAALRRGLPVLDSAKSKSREYWQEVRTLKNWLDQLRDEKTIQERIKVFGTGNWTTIGPGGMARAPVPGHAAGWRVPGHGSGDTVPAMLTPGEAVVPKRLVPAVAPFLSAHKVPGFAGGGVVPAYAGAVAGLKPWGQHNRAATLLAITSGIAKSLAHAASAAFSGPGGGSFSANAALAHRLYASQLSPASWAAWNYVAMRESGWNQFARNPSSGAYGIAQALPPSKYPFAGQAAGGSNPTAQISWMWNYMAGRYGGPRGAAAHERAFNWYGNGLDAIFRKPTLIGVGERGPERVQVTPRGRSAAPVRVELVVRTGAGATDLDRAIVTIIQKHVEVVGGGDVSVALGQKF